MSDLYSDQLAATTSMTEVWGAGPNDVAGVMSPWDLVGAINVQKHRSALGTGAIGDRAIIQQAIDDAFNAGGGIVYAPHPVTSYMMDAPLVMKKNVTLIGDIRERGVKFTRNGAFPIIETIGTSVLTQSNGEIGHVRRARLERIELDGNAYAAEIFLGKAASLLDFRDVRFSNSMKELVKTYELMDSRFWNCRFTHADDPTGTYYAVNLNSGSDGTTTYEYTNQIHFYSCVWEENIGRSLIAQNLRTNEIYFTKCKVENLGCSLSNQFNFSSCDEIVLDMQVTTKGATPALIDQVFNFLNCGAVKGSLTWEHQGDVAAHANVDTAQSVTPVAASVTNFAKFDACWPVNVDIMIRGYSMDKLQGTVAVSVVNQSTQTDIQVRWYSNTKKKSGVTSGIQNLTLENLHIKGYTTAMGLRIQSFLASLTATGIWDIGRIADDGAGNPRLKVIHNNGSNEASIMEWTQERDVYLSSGLKAQLANSIAAAGTTLAAATALSYTAITHIVTTITAGSAEAVKLPAAGTHKLVIVKNVHATATLKVFPNVSGGTIDGGSAGASVDILPGKTRWFFTTASNVWQSALSA